MDVNNEAAAMTLVKRFARSALVYFVVVGVLGTYLRARFIVPLWPFLEFSNVLHAHSHVAYFGWTSLALMAAMYRLLPRLTGRPLQGLPFIRWQLALTHVATVGALVTFTIGGYTPISIVFSTFNVFLWYFFMRIYWLNVRGLPRPLPVALRYWHGAVLLLFISSLGTWLISAVTASGLGGAVGQQAGLNMFLTNFTDGWLVLGLMGVVVAWLTSDEGRAGAAHDAAHDAAHHPSRPLPGQWAAGPLLWIVVLTPFTFLAELTMFELPLGILLLGLSARFMLAIPYFWFLFAARTAHRVNSPASAGEGRSGTVGPRNDAVHAFVVAGFVFFALKAVIHFALGIVAAVPSRHMFVAYLHLDLLGFVSCGLLAALYIVFAPKRDDRRSEATKRSGQSGTATSVASVAGPIGALILSIGVVTMVVTLAVVAVVSGSSEPASRSAANDLLQAAFVFGAVALVGIVVSVAGLWPHTKTRA